MGACLQDVLALGAHGDARARARPAARIILEFLVEHTYNKDNCPYYRHPVLGGELVYFPYITGIIGSLSFRSILDQFGTGPGFCVTPGMAHGPYKPRHN